jgi:hypothetical protein
MRKYFSLGLSVALLTGVTSCEKSEVISQNQLDIPATYKFERNGQTSVSYSGQTDRLNQLAEMKAMLQTADAGSIVSEIDLLDMYANTGGDANGNFTFSSSKQLKNKTFDLDQTYFEGMLKSAAAASVNGSNGVLASMGSAGLITRGGNNSTILVDEKGFEFTQVFEKGIMGGVFYYQIVNVYLTDDKIGDAVDNENVDSVKNYTDMEHHFDEAFGYFGAPVYFTSDYQGTESPRYWAKYSNSTDAVISGMNTSIMDSYKTGRSAIVANEHTIKTSQVSELNTYFGQLAAASAIHYANEAKATTDQGDLLHVLSECYAFTRALRYANPNQRELSPTEVETLLTNTFNDNLWLVKASDLNNLIDALSAAYGLVAWKDIL